MPGTREAYSWLKCTSRCNGSDTKQQATNMHVNPKHTSVTCLGAQLTLVRDNSPQILRMRTRVPFRGSCRGLETYKNAWTYSIIQEAGNQLQPGMQGTRVQAGRVPAPGWCRRSALYRAENAERTHCTRVIRSTSLAMSAVELGARQPVAGCGSSLHRSHHPCRGTSQQDIHRAALAPLPSESLAVVP